MSLRLSVVVLLRSSEWPLRDEGQERTETKKTMCWWSVVDKRNGSGLSDCWILMQSPRNPFKTRIQKHFLTNSDSKKHFEETPKKPHRPTTDETCVNCGGVNRRFGTKCRHQRYGRECLGRCGSQDNEQEASSHDEGSDPSVMHVLCSRESLVCGSLSACFISSGSNWFADTATKARLNWIEEHLLVDFAFKVWPVYRLQIWLGSKRRWRSGRSKITYSPLILWNGNQTKRVICKEGWEFKPQQAIQSSWPYTQHYLILCGDCFRFHRLSPTSTTATNSQWLYSCFASFCLLNVCYWL